MQTSKEFVVRETLWINMWWVKQSFNSCNNLEIIEKKGKAKSWGTEGGKWVQGESRGRKERFHDVLWHQPNIKDINTHSFLLMWLRKGNKVVFAEQRYNTKIQTSIIPKEQAEKSKTNLNCLGCSLFRNPRYSQSEIKRKFVFAEEDETLTKHQ